MLASYDVSYWPLSDSDSDSDFKLEFASLFLAGSIGETMSDYASSL